MAHNDHDKPYRWILQRTQRLPNTSRVLVTHSGVYRSIGHAQRDRDTFRKAGIPMSIVPIPPTYRGY